MNHRAADNSWKRHRAGEDEECSDLSWGMPDLGRGTGVRKPVHGDAIQQHPVSERAGDFNRPSIALSPADTQCWRLE